MRSGLAGWGPRLHRVGCLPACAERRANRHRRCALLCGWHLPRSSCHHDDATIPRADIHRATPARFCCSLLL